MMELIFDYLKLSHVISARFNEDEFAQWRSVHLRGNVRHCARRTTGNAIITRCFCVRALTCNYMNAHIHALCARVNVSL